MKTWTCLLATTWMLGCAEAPEPSVGIHAAPITVGAIPIPIFTRKPLVRHENFDGSLDVSGMKLARPEVLDHVLIESFGEVPSVGSGANARDPVVTDYLLHLGGIDYDPVTRRAEEVTPTMALVMNRFSNEYCQQLLDAGAFTVIGSGATDVEVIEELYQRIRSKPIDATTQAEAEALLIEAPSVDQGWKAVCSFFFLIEGSLLLY